MTSQNRLAGARLWARLALTTVTLALLGVVSAPRAASAQVAASEISQFRGTWELPLEAQGQQFSMTIRVTEGEDGNADAVVAGQTGEQEVETLSMNGESLELTYETSAQGMTVPVLIRMTPLAEEGTAEVELDFADGQFFLDGTATRTE